MVMNTSMLWVNQEKRRYYKVLVYEDLLGDLVFLRNWGSLDNARGGVKTEIVSLQEAEDLLVNIEKRRLKRNYKPVTSKPDSVLESV